MAILKNIVLLFAFFFVWDAHLSRGFVLRPLNNHLERHGHAHPRRDRHSSLLSPRLVHRFGLNLETCNQARPELLELENILQRARSAIERHVQERQGQDQSRQEPFVGDRPFRHRREAGSTEEEYEIHNRHDRRRRHRRPMPGHRCRHCFHMQQFCVRVVQQGCEIPARLGQACSRIETGSPLRW